jgi:probable HAF family extracellular repeat protein
MAVLLLILSGSGRAAAIYSINNLGTLGGSTSFGFAINNAGDTAGQASLPSEENSAFLNTNGSTSALTAPHTTNGSAAGINNSRQVVGTTNTFNAAQASLWSNGIFTNLGTLGGTDSYAMAINNAGVIVGGASTSGEQLHAFVYDSGGMSDLGVLNGGTWSSAYAIADNGGIVGYSDIGTGHFRAFRYGGSLQNLGTLGGSDSYGMGINNTGTVVGGSTTTSGYLHAYVDALGSSMVDLGTLGGSSSFAYGVNASGSVVGSSFTWSNAATHAFVWRDGSLYDLNSLVAQGSGWVLNEAYGINDRGQVVGTGTFAGQSRGFRLDPEAPLSSAVVSGSTVSGVPEPGTISLLAAGLVLVAIGIRKRIPG